MAESLEPGASVSLVARRHDVNANLLFTWRREFKALGVMTSEDGSRFVPARITADPAPAMSAGLLSMASGRMEIALASGERVIVGTDVDAAALARVIEVLSRR